MSAKLDRLSRSVVHLGSLLEQTEAEGWALVLLDFDVDTSKPTGRLVAHVLAAVAEFERQRIRERTREALSQVKAQWVRLGRPRQLTGDVVERVEASREDGWTLARIAADLNDDEVPTAQGGRKWWPSTVAGVLRSIELNRAASQQAGGQRPCPKSVAGNPTGSEIASIDTSIGVTVWLRHR